MRCSRGSTAMQCEDIEGALVSEGLESLSGAARAHLAVCSSCRDSVADLEAIAQAARSLPAEVEPPARVWVSLRAQLEAEGLIRETLPVPARVRAPWWQPMAQLFSHRLLAASLAGCLLLAAAVLELRRPLPGPAQSSAPASASVPVDDQLFNSSRTLNEQEQDLSNMIQASTSRWTPPSARTSRTLTNLLLNASSTSSSRPTTNSLASISPPPFSKKRNCCPR